MNNDANKLYFPNLNGLRFIAALFVIINHTEQLKAFYFNGIELSNATKNIGKLGVVIFFVLSGFLITFLLLTEQASNTKIDFKKFYSRRFFRIVPLYFLVIFITFFIIQHFSFWEVPGLKNPIPTNFQSTLLLHLFFLPNVAVAVFGFLPYIAQAWSIGTEVQSYILWPILLKNFKKNQLAIMMGVILFYIAVRLLLTMPFFTIPYQKTLQLFWNHFNLDIIAVGGIFAILAFQKNRILPFLVDQKTFYATVIFTSFLLVFGIRIPYFHYLGYAFLFGIIILNLAFHEKLKKCLEFWFLKYLGNISYGIYMYHFMILIPVLKLVSSYDIKTNWVIYPLLLIGSIAISSISYHFFETYFLKLKVKFSTSNTTEKKLV